MPAPAAAGTAHGPAEWLDSSKFHPQAAVAAASMHHQEPSSRDCRRAARSGLGPNPSNSSQHANRVSRSESSICRRLVRVTNSRMTQFAAVRSPAAATEDLCFVWLHSEVRTRQGEPKRDAGHCFAPCSSVALEVQGASLHCQGVAVPAIAWRWWRACLLWEIAGRRSSRNSARLL